MCTHFLTYLRRLRWVLQEIDQTLYQHSRIAGWNDITAFAIGHNFNCLPTWVATTGGDAAPAPINTMGSASLHEGNQDIAFP